MFEITGDTILAGAQAAARERAAEQGLTVDQWVDGTPPADQPPADDRLFEVSAVNCYRQPISLAGPVEQAKIKPVQVHGQAALDEALAARTGHFNPEPGVTQRHRTFEFAVRDVAGGGVQHYRRTRGGLERVEAPPVVV